MRVKYRYAVSAAIFTIYPARIYLYLNKPESEYHVTVSVEEYHGSQKKILSVTKKVIIGYWKIT